MIGIFGDEDMGQQPRSGSATLDRQGRHRRLGDRLAGPAGELRPDVADHLEAGRNAFQHLGHILPEPAHRPAAARAETVRRRPVHDLLPGQVVRQWPADGHFAMGGRSFERGLRCLALCLPLLEVLEQKLHLSDGVGQLLGGAAELRPLSLAICAFSFSTS